MGPLVARSREHLGQTNGALATARRLLLEAAKTVAAGGGPPGADAGYYHVRAIERVLPPAADWR